MDEPNLQTVPKPRAYKVLMSPSEAACAGSEDQASGHALRTANLRVAFVAPPGCVLLSGASSALPGLVEVACGAGKRGRCSPMQAQHAQSSDNQLLWCVPATCRGAAAPPPARATLAQALIATFLPAPPLPPALLSLQPTTARLSSGSWPTSAATRACAASLATQAAPTPLFCWRRSGWASLPARWAAGGAWMCAWRLCWPRALPAHARPAVPAEPPSQCVRPAPPAAPRP